LTDELTKQYTPNLASLTLLPSKGGVFEVKADDTLIFSKKALGRHAEPGEVARLFEGKMGVKPQPRE
jgi:selenoprotein W-related protein